MKNAEAEGQQQNAGHVSAPISSPSESTNTLVAAPTTASVEGLQLLVQARLSVSSPNDPFEHEAESMADEFVKSIHGRTVSAPTSSVGSVARSVPDNGLVEGGGGLATTDDTASAIMSARAGGQGLSGDVRSRFEGFFGADLGGVKIHNDGTSDNLCRSINAEAFTTGTDVFFSSRSFKPGSSSGDHLLAHELTHVVQQGNAPALSRRAMPDIQREWYNPLSWGKSDEPTKAEPPKAEPHGAAKSDGARSKVGLAGQLIGLGQIPAGAAKAEFKDSDDPNSVKAAGDAGDTGDSIGLIACTGALLVSVMRYYSEWDSESDGSGRTVLTNAVKSAVGVAQKSTSLAQSAGATVAASAVPGLGLAVNVIELANQCIRFDDMRLAISDSEKTIKSLKAKDDQTLADRKLLASLQLLSEKSKSEHKRAIVKMMGNFVGMVGQLSLISGIGASAGGAMVVTNAAIQGLTMLQSKVAEWWSAEAIKESRDRLGEAKQALKDHENNKSGNLAEDEETKNRLTERVQDLSIENLGLDAYAAAREVITYCAGAIKKVGDDNWEIDDGAMSLLTRFEIDQKWLLKYAENPSEELLDKGAKIICETIGTAPNPLALKQDLLTAAKKAQVALTYVARGSGYFVFWSGKQIAHITVVGAEGIQDNVLTPLWDAATATPGLIWSFFHEANKLRDAPKEGDFSSKQPDYFSSEKELESKCRFLIGNPVAFYFESLTKRREKARPEILTRFLKSNYEKLVETAKKTPTDGTEPYASSTQQIEFINEKIKVAIVRELNKEDLLEVPVSVKDGEVDFKYKRVETTSAKEVNNEADTKTGKPAEVDEGNSIPMAFAVERHLRGTVSALTRYTLEPYFQQKAARGTDVKPETITALLRPRYRGFVRAANMTLAGRKPFASAAEQIKLINAVMEEEILYVLPERVDENSLSVTDGTVDFKYKGDSMAKTKGWFADFRGRQSV
jgi:hypothetical protein